MANILKDIQCAGSDTRTPMLDRTDFASWKQCIRLYCRAKENRVNILKSINEGPFKMGTVQEPLAEGTEGAPHLGDTIHDYYVRFAKLINDTRNIKMTMSRMQLNSKFINNMLPKWGRFVTAVKLNRGLRDSNCDQLYAYLKQHEAHVNENKMMLDRFTQHIVDPLVLMSNVSHQQHYSQSSSTLPSTMFRVDRIEVKGPIHWVEVQLDDCDAFDSDVDEAPTVQTMFMVNLSSADPVYDEAGPSVGQLSGKDLLVIVAADIDCLPLGFDPFLLFTMSNITNIKFVLTQKGLDVFCHKFHILEDVLPHTRFFEYANFRLPLSTFLVNMLRHYRINLSQLSVITASKFSHFEILCRVHNIEPTFRFFRCFYVNSKNKGWMSFSKRSDSDVVCYTKPIDSLKHWNGHFFWVDSFACSASFSWHTDNNVPRDPFPKSTEFNMDHYVVLVAHSDPFWKFLEPFLCLVGMSRYYTLDEDNYLSFLHDDGTDIDLLAFIQVTDPTKVKVGERERAEGEAKLLDSTVGHVVSLLPIALARANSELEASVDRLFDEGVGTYQGVSTIGGGQEAETGLVTGVRIITDENVVDEKPKCLQVKD
uniref:Putative transposase (Putative), gypsy type n=1 Tax=Tanacetum cinerariifolium TaxID=118510 RepID=A0A6L2JKC7_TANCI|nr:putative transposase (putative), gypsy type [Tanacetum cinerariifolium]